MYDTRSSNAQILTFLVTCGALFSRHMTTSGSSHAELNSQPDSQQTDQEKLTVLIRLSKFSSSVFCVWARMSHQTLQMS